MAKESSQAKNSKAFTGEGVDVLLGAQQTQQDNPIFQVMQALGLGAVQDPLSLGPEQVQILQDESRAQAQQGFRSIMDELGAQFSGPGGSGIRGGAFQNAAAGAGADLANNLAQGDRQVQIQAAMQRLPDILSAMGIGQGQLNQESQFARDIANVFAGGANAQASAPSGSSGLGALGGLFGSVLGAAGNVGGFGQLFGGATPPTTP